MPSSTPTSAADLNERLRLLYVERALAGLEGLSNDAVYMADLDGEIAASHAAYVGAAVTEIATLRARLDGPLQG
jgi:hypothetical protein